MANTMATSQQLLALLRSHIDGNNEHFLSVAMQVAAHEARLGHGNFAKQLRDLVDKARTPKPTALASPTASTGFCGGILVTGIPLDDSRP